MIGLLCSPTRRGPFSVRTLLLFAFASVVIYMLGATWLFAGHWDVGQPGHRRRSDAILPGDAAKDSSLPGLRHGSAVLTGLIRVPPPSISEDEVLDDPG
jgi:hypothetical protein